ncbi:uncharacterized protein VTP21DRAFT_3615 [Calcarisporiella thermophila]|uniref:uncharacterized protein n=1 Tax=Calcarisporiella thermophila TaxID=911321 RepID=UPI0037449BA2
MNYYHLNVTRALVLYFSPSSSWIVENKASALAKKSSSSAVDVADEEGVAGAGGGAEMGLESFVDEEEVESGAERGQGVCRSAGSMSL